jgi:hypothetical protein
MVWRLCRTFFVALKTQDQSTLIAIKVSEAISKRDKTEKYQSYK